MKTARLVQSTREPLPHSVEAEQAVIGGLMVDGAAWSAVADLLTHEDFSRADHKLIFSAAAVVGKRGEPTDLITLSEFLGRNGQLDQVGGVAYLSTLARDTPGAANISTYAGIVRERTLLRSLRRLCGNIIQSVNDAGERSAVDLITSLEGELTKLRAFVHTVKTIAPEPVSAWAERQAPAARDWVVEGLIPAGRVTSFLGHGGSGKTTIAAQLAVHIALSRNLWGINVAGGPVLGIFCEDEREEIERRIRAACAADQIDLSDMNQLFPVSRDGLNNLLCRFESDNLILTSFYRELEATIAELRPRLVILDTAADIFAGDFMSTPHVRQFLKTCLGGLCVRHGCAVLLIAHPSASGINSGDGGGFSTAWNNSVRSRLYLRKPVSEDKDAVQDRRVLEVKKANYAVNGLSISLIWQDGCFVQDPEPIEESSKVRRAPRADTGLALAVLHYFRTKAANGSIVTFGAVYDHLKAAGELPTGAHEAVRKTVQRTLKSLVGEGLLRQSQVPRGYRLSLEGK